MATWLVEYIPLVIFALLMFTIIARGFRKETRFDQLLTVLAAIIGVAIALYLSFLHVITR
jgi:Na+/serine symporter